MNHMSHKLQLHEIAAMQADPAVRARLIKSYELMLDFYGLKLKDPQTGTPDDNGGGDSQEGHGGGTSGLPVSCSALSLVV